MNLKRYFQRIHYSGSTEPTLDTLSALQRHHVLSVPFENLDVQLGTPLTTDIEAAFDKIVMRNRGGWCYEQNGLFGWALSTLGFRVTRVAAGVRRDERGDKALANHLCLLVQLPDTGESTYLADVGFGGSMIRPIPLAEFQHRQDPFRIGLRQLDDGHWQFQETTSEDSVNYDFLATPGDEEALAQKCSQLQSDPESSFVLNVVAQQRTPDTHLSLRGRVFTRTSASGKESKTLQSGDEFVAALRNTFKLDVKGAGDLWPKIVARHDVLFGQPKEH